MDKKINWDDLKDDEKKLLVFFKALTESIDSAFPGKRERVIDVLVDLFLTCRIIDCNDKWDAECLKVKVVNHMNEVIKGVFHDKP